MERSRPTTLADLATNQFGRGISVVAIEVMALAGETAKATEEIESQINSIQGEARSAIGHIDESRGGDIEIF